MTQKLPLSTAATAPHELEQILDSARAAFPLWSGLPPTERARVLLHLADEIDSTADSLVRIAITETGLTEARLRGELRRTTVQIRLFADTIREGTYLDARLDEADDDYVLGQRPDLRRVLEPVGVCVNFSASNFPFAFSVVGGDTVSALAAGCPVIVKTHSGHPELSLATARVAIAALREAGAPEGLLSVVFGREQGTQALQDDRVDVGTFTGSIEVGRHLASLAATRPRPIPFFGELGSVNPVFATPAALLERGAQLANEFVGSVSGSAGQLCTKPGFFWIPDAAASDFSDAVTAAAAKVPEHRMLTPGVGRSYLKRRDEVLRTPGVRCVFEGVARELGDGHVAATVTLVAVAPSVLFEHRETLLDEVFGPFSIIVEYPTDTDLVSSLNELYEGNLTGALHAGEHERTSVVKDLIAGLARKTGRVIFDGWPTGVPVTPALQHGGPFPATTNDSSTSVGTAAISRFLRGVAYQAMPEDLLPAPVQTSNPWGVPQRLAPAGESTEWGRWPR